MIRWKDFRLDDSLGPSLILPHEIVVEQEAYRRALFEFNQVKRKEEVAHRAVWNPNGNIKEDVTVQFGAKGFASNQETTTSKTPHHHSQEVSDTKSTQDELGTVGTSLVNHDTEISMEASSVAVTTHSVEGE